MSMITFLNMAKKFYAMMEEIDFPAKLELIVGEEVEVKGKLIEVEEKEGGGLSISIEDCAKPGKGGWCDLHDDVDDVVELRTCAHDAVYNSALCLGVELDREHILKSVPPCRTVNTDIKKIFRCVKKDLSYEGINMTKKGGNEFDLLTRERDGVFIAFTKIFIDANKKPCHHFFVYDSDEKSPNESDTYGVIVDNRVRYQKRFITQNDRKEKDTIRKMLQDYFGGEVRVDRAIRVYRQYHLM